MELSSIESKMGGRANVLSQRTQSGKVSVTVASAMEMGWSLSVAIHHRRLFMSVD
jgi:hypothetical protein